MNPADFTLFCGGYRHSMIFTTTDDDGNYVDAVDLSPESALTALDDCQSFCNAALLHLQVACERPGYDWTRAGVDFFLTRNGHGAGFWCRDELEEHELGERLSEIARTFGQVDTFYDADKNEVYT